MRDVVPSPLVSSHSLPAINTRGRMPKIKVSGHAAGQDSSWFGARDRISPSERVNQATVIPATLPIKSPLLTLEIKLSQAISYESEAVSPTLRRSAACFACLQELLRPAMPTLAALSKPFLPLLRLMSRELWAAVYDGTRGGVAHFEELRRMRMLVAKQAEELQAERKRSEPHAGLMLHAQHMPGHTCLAMFCLWPYMQAHRRCTDGDVRLACVDMWRRCPKPEDGRREGSLGGGAPEDRRGASCPAQPKWEC